MFQFTLEKDEYIRVTRAVCQGEQIPHTHDFIEIVYICEGGGRHAINADTYPVKRGDLLFINFNEVHAFSTEQSMEYINCLVSPEFLSQELVNSENALDVLTLEIFKDFYDMDRGICPHISFQGVEMLEMEALFSDMIRETERKAPGYVTILKSYVSILLTRIFRVFKDPEHSCLTGGLSRITPEVLKYIRDNYNKKITLKEIARYNFYNPSYFSSIFKECFGKTPLEYITEIRMERAIQMMRESGLSIEEICHSIGYSNKKHFYKVFKSTTGMTPNHFRKNL